MATPKKPAAKSTRSKRAKATAPKKTPKKASPKKRPAKAPTASSARSASNKATRKSAKNSKKTAKQSAEPKPSIQASCVGDEIVTIDRRRSDERRKENATGAVQAQGQPKLERRKKVQRRRQIDPTTCERDYSLEEVEFMNALDDYKRKSGRMFPTCSEILEVIHAIGYVKLSSMELAARRGSQQLLEEGENKLGAEFFPGLQEGENLLDTESVDIDEVTQTLESLSGQETHIGVTG